MYTNDNPGAAAQASTDPGVLDNVREIFPGATALPSVRNATPWRKLRNLGSETGMATAEYANVMSS
ncbi:hypothetical protein AL755_20165 [Arthrobacter sp. ERGS1:01]|uniref:hypothetical protein n=1 Tax=Arthrobacter sp. ERGS1:01 TaxID=1704044 RepID=UPI0006B540D6|nr:hypothetical protein [Arthrobacter sp. ERGS1:01]ALE07255.1 hypothetical protein AL755_20165 [Arthrobacter sp. ERGS1:01]